MNVFVLSTGRCGSTTFVRACRHITNYSASHESRTSFLGSARLAYPEGHIEADNRLSWFLGRLEARYGDRAFYVHLRRSDAETARSLVQRYQMGIVQAYRKGILLGLADRADRMQVALDYCDTVNSNIELFLRDKTRRMTFSLESATDDFRRFWSLIGAEGDLAGALAEWDRTYNASPLPPPARGALTLLSKAFFKLWRIARGLPSFVRSA